MAQAKEYNTGPVNYLFGHGRICNNKPPKLIDIKISDIVALASGKNDAEGYYFSISVHTQILNFLMKGAEFGNVVLSQTIELISTKAVYIQHVSRNFEIDKVERDILDGGHELKQQIRNYDIRKFQDRVDLMQLPAPTHYKDPLKSFQKENMGFIQGKIVYSWEIRERVIFYPYGIDTRDISIVPSSKEYLKLRYKFGQLKDYSGHNKQDVSIQLYFNKSAIENDISNAKKVGNLLTYQKFPHIVKHGELSGRHLIFLHLQCTKPLCNHSKETCDKSGFFVSDLLTKFISKLHVMVENTDTAITPKTPIFLYLADNLGEAEAVKDAVLPFEYYDLAMPPDPTIVLGSCSGNDRVIDEIFGF